jgi:uncharacterized protein (TIGR00251 family)
MRSYLRERAEGVEILVLVQPRASRTRVVGEHDGRLKLQLASPPVDGAANAELVEFLAKLLGVPKRAVAVTAGETSRRKTVVATGIAVAAVEAALQPPATP